MVTQVKYSGIIATTIVRDIGGAVRDDLLDAGQEDVFRFCPIVPGDIAWDECQCGQLAQTITNVAASSQPPQRDTDIRQAPCGPGMAVISVTLSLTRCVPVLNDNGDPPSCEALDAAAVTLEIDREVTRAAVVCYLRELERAYTIFSYGVNPVVSVGPQGECAGIELTYWFSLPDKCC